VERHLISNLFDIQKIYQQKVMMKIIIVFANFGRTIFFYLSMRRVKKCF